MNNEKIANFKENNELSMYFSPEVATKFAELEQNEKNFQVAEIVDKLLLNQLEKVQPPIHVAELGGGAHPDRYHEFFGKLLNMPDSRVDWVDVSPQMLELAEKYLMQTDDGRERIIKFEQQDILSYLKNLPAEELSLAIMKYTIDHIVDLEELFGLLADKLRKQGSLVATIGNLDPELKSISTNARFEYNGEEFPEDETKTLQDGDSFTVKFFKVSGDPKSGYLEGGQTVKHYHSREKILRLAEKFGFEAYFGDWKEYLSEQESKLPDQAVLVLNKK